MKNVVNFDSSEALYSWQIFVVLPLFFVVSYLIWRWYERHFSLDLRLELFSVMNYVVNNFEFIRSGDSRKVIKFFTDQWGQRKGMKYYEEFMAGKTLLPTLENAVNNIMKEPYSEKVSFVNGLIKLMIAGGKLSNGANLFIMDMAKQLSLNSAKVEYLIKRNLG